MSDVTIAQFADTLKISVEKLLVQLDEAGIGARGQMIFLAINQKQIC